MVIISPAYIHDKQNSFVKRCMLRLIWTVEFCTASCSVEDVCLLKAHNMIDILLSSRGAQGRMQV